MERLHIAAAVILSPDQNKIFITQRPKQLHKGGYWEFPGGKVEEGESAEQGMIRELFEEVGIVVTKLQHFQSLEYDYPEKSLAFDFFVVTEFEHQPYGKEGQVGKWINIAELVDYTFPEANVAVLEKVLGRFA